MCLHGPVFDVRPHIRWARVTLTESVICEVGFLYQSQGRSTRRMLLEVGAAFHVLNFLKRSFKAPFTASSTELFI